MAIVATDLKCYLTGAASDGGVQAAPDASLGNYRSSTEPTSGVDNNLFDDITGAQAAAGHTDYRCFVFKNTHATLSLVGAKIFFQADDANASTTYSLALERPATANLTNGAAQTIVNETTAPTVNTTAHNGVGSGISNWALSTAANSYANGIAVNQGSAGTDLAPGDLIFVWLKRIIAAEAVAANNISFTLRLEGDTAA